MGLGDSIGWVDSVGLGDSAGLLGESVGLTEGVVDGIVLGLGGRVK